jgi:glycosyltransferase involved in cell wall biosynthesis
MQTDKPEIVFTFPCAMGGVSSFNFNIINNSRLIKNFYSKVVLLKEASDDRSVFTEKFSVDEQIVFEYSQKENQYHLQKRLNSLLGKSAGAIVTDNGLTIESAVRFNNPKTIFSLIHDYFYVNQNVKLGGLADVAVAHSSFFSDAVFSADPFLFTNRSFYIPYGVKQTDIISEKNNEILNLVFLGRLENEKGVMMLFEIEEQLRKKNIIVNWTLIGKGSLKDILVKQWTTGKIRFVEPDTTDEVYDILRTQDIFVFPTIFEGTPVSILECLSNAVVTITNDLPGGIRDVVNEHTGFRCTVNDRSQFVEKICLLNGNRILLQKMQNNCLTFARHNYDVIENADKYFELFSDFALLKRKKVQAPRKLKKLDAAFIPNSLTKMIRAIK